MRKVFLTWILASLSLSVSATAETSRGSGPTIVCQASGQKDVVISINTQKMRGRTVSCISADFLDDGVPCAPNGAWALSYPTGAAGLDKFVDHWADYGNHSGPIVYFAQGPTSIHFDGGRMGFDRDGKSEGFIEKWSIDVDRLSGRGRAKFDGKDGPVYACSRNQPMS